MKYPEFREQFKHATWYRGHLCEQNGNFYKLVKVDGEKQKQLKSFTYDELTDKDKQLIADVKAENAERDKHIDEFVKSILPAKNALISYVQEHGKLMDRSNVSESEYWHVKGIDGMNYTIRISGHRYPTGSMTNLLLNKIDSTDFDCRPYCKLLGIDYE